MQIILSHQVLLAFAVTFLAGLSTVIGGALVLFFKQPSYRVLSFGLAFAAGAMIYISLTEILNKSIASFSQAFEPKYGFALGTFAFLLGMILVLLLDRFIPNPHQILEPKHAAEIEKQQLKRTALMTLFAITAHNLPEGLATFFATLESPTLGAPLAIASAIHNIPEGIAVSVPIFYATGSKMKAFKLSFLSGLSEPVGALVGYLLLMPIMNDIVFGMIFASVAGIMVYISLDELLPSAREYGEHHISIYGLVSGMIVMAISLLLFL